MGIIMFYIWFTILYVESETSKEKIITYNREVAVSVDKYVIINKTLKKLRKWFEEEGFDVEVDGDLESFSEFNHEVSYHVEFSSFDQASDVLTEIQPIMLFLETCNSHRTLH